MKVLLAVVVVLLAIIANLFSFAYMRILRQNGHQVGIFLSGWYDLPKFIRLIRKEPDQQKKRTYRFILMGLVLSFLAFALGTVLLLSMV